MNAVIAGTHVHWRHINEETGLPAVDCDGEIVAVDLSAGKFVFLVLRSDGLFVSAAAEDVEVAADEPVAIPSVIALPDGGADHLVRLATGIRGLGLGDDITDTDPVGQAITLLGEALSDMRTMQEQIDAAGGGDDRLTQLLTQNKTLSDEVAELRAAAAAKKVKKPKTGEADKPDKAGT